MTKRSSSEIGTGTRSMSWAVIGHFTTAGFRKLPAVIKSDLEAAEKCIEYFDKALVRSGYSVNYGLVDEVARFKDDKERQRYLQSFAQMAERGLFSFDTKPFGSCGGWYHLVASPWNPLRIDELPPEIAALVCRARADRPFKTGLR